MSLAGVAKETLQILEGGCYVAPSGHEVSLAAELASAIAGTRLYRPEEAQALVAARQSSQGAPRVEVTPETTQLAAWRLIVDEGVEDPLLLNFASARNPGGGFLGGAKAQEEDLCRCSGLYPCLLEARPYYDANRAERSLLYTDHAIYSPRVPFFRTASRMLCERTFLASVITSPAPNARSERAQKDPAFARELEPTFRRRAGQVLAIAAAHGHRSLVLGAWGCGAFRNDPTVAAGAFGAWLEDPRFGGAFDRVVFAVFDKTKELANRIAFERRFRERAPPSHT
ncbi:MAG: TIGR02452 family protein [Sandaracinaceae bacterium]|nr:TIGR02452 family protein [Sandaracinaceae bacterium]